MAASDMLSRPARMDLLPRWDWARMAWRTLRVANIAVVVVLILGLVFWPVIVLRILWNLLVPILPLSFLIAPQLWRGICPLATLNQWSGGLFARRQLHGRLLTAANTLGILLLVLLVPARRFVFNENGPALAATIVTVAFAALILGALFDRRAGFCNAVCPILPVERLYGQHPLLQVDNRRCDRCTLCIPRGCLEQDPAKSITQAIGTAISGHRWLTTSYGILTACLPGFIVGYYTTSNGPWSIAPGLYLWIALCSATSYLITTVAVRVLGLTGPASLALLAAVAILLYYWWAVPLIAETLQVPAAGVWIARGAAFAVVACWLAHAWPKLQGRLRKV
jgi:hypothetical protein